MFTELHSHPSHDLKAKLETTLLQVSRRWRTCLRWVFGWEEKCITFLWKYLGLFCSWSRMTSRCVMQAWHGIVAGKVCAPGFWWAQRHHWPRRLAGICIHLSFVLRRVRVLLWGICLACCAILPIHQMTEMFIANYCTPHPEECFVFQFFSTNLNLNEIIC